MPSHRPDNTDPLAGRLAPVHLAQRRAVEEHHAARVFGQGLTYFHIENLLCLPGGRPAVINARAPRRFCRGAWRFRDLQGYTSRGAGVSGVAVRYHCPPEVTRHVLRCG